MFDFGNYINDDETQKRKVKREELMEKFFSAREPEPTIDRNKASRLQRMGRLNTLSRAGSVLGDVLSTALGGTVRQRQPDNISPMLYETYQSMMDKYETDKDAYDYRGFQKELQNISMGIGELDKEEALAQQRVKNALDYNKQQMDWNEFSAKFGLDKTKAENQKAYWDERNRIAAGKALDDGAYARIWMNGKSTRLDEAEFMKLYVEMKKDNAFSDADFKAMMEKYQNNSKLALTALIQTWIDRKETIENGQRSMKEQQPKVDQLTKPAPFFQPPPQYGVNGPRRQADQTYPAPVDSSQVQTPVDTTQVYTPVAPAAVDSIPTPVNQDTLQQAVPIVQDSIAQMQQSPLPVAQDSVATPAPVYAPSLNTSPRDAAIKGTGQLPTTQDTARQTPTQAQLSPRDAARMGLPTQQTTPPQRKPIKRGTFFTPIN